MPQAHIVRAMEARTLSDSTMKDAILGHKTKESIMGECPRAVTTDALMNTLKRAIMNFKMSPDSKWRIWLFLVFLFIGFLWVSELLGTDRLRPLKNGKWLFLL